jgi:hypothetical protein
MKEGIFHSLIVTILLLLLLLIPIPISIVVTASQADLIKTDYLPLLTEFEYFTESSISKFNDFIALIASFAIVIHDQDYQLAKYRDYSSLLAEFIYSLTDPNTITTIAKTTSMHIASDFNVQEQESITAIRYSLLDISISVDVSIIEKGDNSQWN